MYFQIVRQTKEVGGLNLFTDLEARGLKSVTARPRSPSDWVEPFLACHFLPLVGSSVLGTPWLGAASLPSLPLSWTPCVSLLLLETILSL